MDAMMQTLGVDILTAVRAKSGEAFVEARYKRRNCPHELSCLSLCDLTTETVGGVMRGAIGTRSGEVESP
jgi:hypothetical protein